MSNLYQTIRRLGIVFLFSLLVAHQALAITDYDDSNLFMDAFNAFQGKDFLLSIEKPEPSGATLSRLTTP